MQKYPVRASARAQLTEARLIELCRRHFEGGALSDGRVEARYGALARLAARVDGKELAVEVTMDPSVPGDVAQETIRRYNRFLEEATGYTTKERAARLKKSTAKAGA